MELFLDTEALAFLETGRTDEEVLSTHFSLGENQASFYIEVNLRRYNAYGSGEERPWLYVSMYCTDSVTNVREDDWTRNRHPFIQVKRSKGLSRDGWAFV